MKLSCKECLPCRFEQHPCMLVGEIVPRLLAWVAGEGRVYSKEQKEADHEWNTCLINVDYCIRILKEVRKQIEDRLSHQDLRGHHEVLL